MIYACYFGFVVFINIRDGRMVWRIRANWQKGMEAAVYKLLAG